MFDAAMMFPAQLLESGRTHNRFVREALQIAMTYHHHVRMRDRFTRGARAKYGFTPRQDKYVKRKLRFQRAIGVPGNLRGLDLVWTGASRQAILTNARQLVSGTVTGGTLRGRLIMRLPFGGGTGSRMDDAARARLGKAPAQKKAGVTPDRIVAELKKVLPEEARETADQMQRLYVALIKQDMKRPRLVRGATL